MATNALPAHGRDAVSFAKPIKAIGLLLLAALAAATYGSLTSSGTVRIAEADMARYRDLRFTDGLDGGVDITDAGTGRTVMALKAGEGLFIRSLVRSRAQDRERHGLGSETPFRVAALNDGRLMLIDPVLDVNLNLAAYGPSGKQAFSELLEK